MRTALLLLLLLAVAAVPGSVLPQRQVSAERVAAYLRQHPSAGPWLDRIAFFDVYSSPWFSAVYLLLFVSLIGCLLPRLRQHASHLLNPPPPAPARFDRLPQHSPDTEVNRAPDETAASVRAAWRRSRWRVAVRKGDDGVVTVAAEKGYLKETGNLLFHIALLVVLIGVAIGSWFGWHANRFVIAGTDFGFCNTLQQYDEYGLGPRVDASDLSPFCVNLNDFQATYLDNGQPVSYTASLSYTDGLNAPTRTQRVEVNHPLRLSGANVYLLGHGYAPVLRFTDRFGVTQTSVVAFLPEDGRLTSTGVAMFPDANLDPKGPQPGAEPNQVAFAGTYLPTMPQHANGQLSTFPAERNPALFLVAYAGDLGLGVGIPQSVYELDQRQIDSGQLRQVAMNRAMKPGDTWHLPDGSQVTFVGTRPTVSISVRHDPGEPIVLAGALTLLAGLMLSLAGRRRRVWARITPAGPGRSLISFGGLPRTDHPGFGAEFAQVVTVAAEAARPAGDDSAHTNGPDQPAMAGERGQ